MNAPFQARAGLRDPFTAFVCDDATADMLRPVAVEHGWSPEKVNKGGLRNAVQSLSVSASPNILFVDLSESADPLNDINALAEVCEPGTSVIASGTVNDERLYRVLVASGVRGILNFAPVPLSVPSHVNLVGVDLSIQLENLAYKVQRTDGEVSCAG